jgi:hypothetical protein
MNAGPVAPNEPTFGAPGNLPNQTVAFLARQDRFLGAATSPRNREEPAMATAAQSTVVFDREQRNSFGSLLGDAFQNGTGFADEVRFWIAGGRLFEMLDWRDMDSDREAYEVTVDEEILWLVKRLFEPNVEEFCVPGLKEALVEEARRDEYPDDESREYWRERNQTEISRCRGRITATQMILEAVA